MSIKFAQQDRVAQYGIKLGVLLYAAWSVLARLLASGDPGGRRRRGSSGSSRKAAIENERYFSL